MYKLLHFKERALLYFYPAILYNIAAIFEAKFFKLKKEKEKELVNLSAFN